VRGRPQPHLPEFDEIQDHLHLNSPGFLACMDNFFFSEVDLGLMELWVSVFSSVGLFFFFFFGLVVFLLVELDKF
jgi:hypothetical protein